jgi:uncharacterized protein
MTKYFLLKGFMMKIVVGQAVRNNDFWNREDILEDLWEAIDSGSHILISAPRRVGKTSIMYKIFDEPQKDYIPLYIDTESADNEKEFWQKLFQALFDESFVNKFKSTTSVFWNKLKNIKIDKITANSVSFGDGDELDYKEAFKQLIKGLDDNQKIIIMIDEFAQTIENIIKYEDVQHALSLLKTHREFRQDVKISTKVTFIYAGSIGLESVVAKIHATKFINDLNSIKVSPLSLEEAIKFSQILTHDKIEIEKEQIIYMLEQIEWLIPFYIQLIIQEVKKCSRSVSAITNETIDQAIHNALDHRNHFENWQSKLKEAFEKDEYLFAKEILNNVSKNSTITSLMIMNIATKHALNEDNKREIIKTLQYDGYINNNDDNSVYRFNSPILRMWWLKNVAN